LEKLVLLDGELTVQDQLGFLAIGERILTLRISCNVVDGNAIIFQENCDYLRIVDA
jgi:hypothetical protein